MTLCLILFQGKSSNKKGLDCLYDCTFDQIQRRIEEIEEYERASPGPGRTQRGGTALYMMKIKMCTKKIIKRYDGTIFDCVEDMIKLELESKEESTGWGRKEALDWAFKRKNDRLKDRDITPYASDL